MGFFIKIQTCTSVKRPDLLVLLTFVIPTIKPCNTGTKEMTIPNFALLYPRLPGPLLAMAGFLFLIHAKTVLLQDYQIHLLLVTIELRCGLRDNAISLVNSMDVLQEDLLRKLGENV